MTSVQIRRLKQFADRKKKKIRDRQEDERKDNDKQNKLFPQPNVEIEKVK